MCLNICNSTSEKDSHLNTDSTVFIKDQTIWQCNIHELLSTISEVLNLVVLGSQTSHTGASTNDQPSKQEVKDRFDFSSGFKATVTQQLHTVHMKVAVAAYI